MEVRIHSPVLVDFYDGAYGPTIRSDVYQSADLGRIQALFQALAAGRIPRTTLADHLTVTFRDMGSLTLQVCETDRPMRQTVFRLNAPSEPGERPHFDWVAPPDQWALNAELLEPLRRDSVPGHQYLSEEGVDDALIELGFRER